MQAIRKHIGIVGYTVLQWRMAIFSDLSRQESGHRVAH